MNKNRKNALISLIVLVVSFLVSFFIPLLWVKIVIDLVFVVFSIILFVYSIKLFKAKDYSWGIGALIISLVLIVLFVVPFSRGFVTGFTNSFQAALQR